MKKFPELSVIVDCPEGFTKIVAKASGFPSEKILPFKLFASWPFEIEINITSVISKIDFMNHRFKKHPAKSYVRKAIKVRLA